MTVHVTVRCYEELNDHLPPAVRKRGFEAHLPGGTTVLGLLRTLSIPAAKVDLVLVNGESASMAHHVLDGDRVALYPVFESLDVAAATSLPGRPLRQPRFAADAGLSSLAARLTEAGYASMSLADESALARLVAEGWILLSRDRQLVDRLAPERAYRLRHEDPDRQLQEVAQRFQLRGVRSLGVCSDARHGPFPKC